MYQPKYKFIFHLLSPNRIEKFPSHGLTHYTRLDVHFFAFRLIRLAYTRQERLVIHSGCLIGGTIDLMLSFRTIIISFIIVYFCILKR